MRDIGNDEKRDSSSAEVHNDVRGIIRVEDYHDALRGDDDEMSADDSVGMRPMDSKFPQ